MHRRLVCSFRKQRRFLEEHPHIALIAFENMLCDMSYMEQLFDIRLDVIYLKRIEEAESIIADFEEDPL